MRLIYLVTHCLDTPRGRHVSKEEVMQWHLSPLDVFDRNGKFWYVLYLGKKYPSRDALPKDEFMGVPVHKLHGRGWTRIGYSDILHTNGEIENVTPYNNDDNVDPWEITNGATGVNSISRHIALEGGWLGLKKSVIAEFHELYPDEMFISLSAYYKQAIKDHPHIRIIGHNQIPNAGKTCPNFDVSKFCRNIGVPEINIGLISNSAK